MLLFFLFSVALLAHASYWELKSGHINTQDAAVWGTLGVNAAGNTPGYLFGAGMCSFNGNILLVGGQKSDTAFYDDAWLYSISNNTWGCYIGQGCVTTNPASVDVTLSSYFCPAGRSRFGFVPVGNQTLAATMIGGKKNSGITNEVLQLVMTAPGFIVMKAAGTANYGDGTYNAANLPLAVIGDSGYLYTGGAGKEYVKFGGTDETNGLVDHLYSYDIENKMWKFIGGSNTSFNTKTDVSASKGIAYSSADGIWPNARAYHSVWLSGNNFYMFGGVQFFNQSAQKLYPFTSYGLATNNDLWMYDISANTWTWVMGMSSLTDYTPVTLYTACAGTDYCSTSYPPGLGSSATWMFGDYLYMFGGVSFNYLDSNPDAAVSTGNTWVYSISDGKWRKDSELVQSNQYETQTYPGGRYLAAGVYDTTTKLAFVYGGYNTSMIYSTMMKYFRNNITCMHTDVCSFYEGQGRCLGTGYSGDDCSIPICSSCSHGTCIAPSVCSCNTGYYGDSCNIIKCGNYYSNQTAVVCNARGTCTSTDNCTCSSSSFSGNLCQTYYCQGVEWANRNDTCGSFGSCKQDLECCPSGWCCKSCECTIGYSSVNSTSGVFTCAAATAGEVFTQILNLLFVGTYLIYSILVIVAIVVVIFLICICICLCIFCCVFAGRKKSQNKKIKEKANQMFLDMENKAEEELQNYLILT